MYSCIKFYKTNKYVQVHTYIFDELRYGNKEINSKP